MTLTIYNNPLLFELFLQTNINTMKRVALLSFLFICLLTLSVKAQKATSINNQPKVILNNNKVTVTQIDPKTGAVTTVQSTGNKYTRLTILLKDAPVTLTTNGQTRTINAKVGDTLRSEGNTHTLIYTGKARVKTVFVETKQ
jgi:hypothetical protein